MTDQPDRSPFLLTLDIGGPQTLRTLPEVIEVLETLDRAWTLAFRLTGIDATLRASDVAARDMPRLRVESLPLMPGDVTRLINSLDALETVPRPEVQLRMESPLHVQLFEVAHDGAVALAAWQVFKYLLDHASEITGLPHRLRYGWYAARAQTDNARIAALQARSRLRLAELEARRAEELEQIARDLRRLDGLITDADFPEDPDALG